MRHAGIAVLLALAVAAVETDAQACSLAAGGIYDRTVWPGADTHPPTNTRVIVRYGLVSYPGLPDQQPPALGPDLVLLDEDGTIVPATSEVVGTEVILRPDAALLPNHVYQVADQRTVPCSGPGTACALTGAPLAFSSFTTGAAADATAPTFAGIASSSLGERQSCESPGGCCSVYDVRLVDLRWSAAADDVAGADVRYNLYRREGAGLTPVATRVTGTQLTGAAVCSGDWWGTNLPAGSYIVRAVDYAGNEDTNSVALQLGNPCPGTITRPQGCAAAGGGPRTSAGASLIGGAAVLLLAGLLRSKARRRTARVSRYRTR